MERLDKELVSRNLIDSRSKAQELIKNNKVLVNGKVCNKSSSVVGDNDEIIIEANDFFKYVSRGGFKLEKALDVFSCDVADKTIMDIGSSTGGFTDCCLQRGAKHMICIDVGSDVMHPSLRNDPRIDLYENTNFKDVDDKLFSGVDMAVIDVSFISIEKIFKKISQQNIKIDIVSLIKPQFECGREIATKYSGVIVNKSIHKDLLRDVLAKLRTLGFECLGLDYSPIKGGDGNIEYLGYFSNYQYQDKSLDIENIVETAFSLV